MIRQFAAFQSAPQLAISEFQVAGTVYSHFAIKDLRSGIIGQGDAADRSLAQTKAVFELIERTVFEQFSKGKPINSSGWAAHTSIEAARFAAAKEVCERDAVLISWMLRRSPLIIGELKVELLSRSFPLLKFGTYGPIAVLGAVIETDKNQRMLVSAASDEISDGISKLSAEAERAALILRTRNHLDDSRLQEHHAVFCAANERELSWLYSNGRSEVLRLPGFQYEDFEVPLWDGSTAFVSYARSPELQRLYWGGNHLGQLNRRRLRSAANRPFRLNRMAHPIL